MPVVAAIWLMPASGSLTALCNCVVVAIWLAPVVVWLMPVVVAIWLMPSSGSLGCVGVEDLLSSFLVEVVAGWMMVSLIELDAVLFSGTRYSFLQFGAIWSAILSLEKKTQPVEGLFTEAYTESLSCKLICFQRTLTVLLVSGRPWCNNFEPRFAWLYEICIHLSNDKRCGQTENVQAVLLAILPVKRFNPR
jgi:hypothetical protein